MPESLLGILKLCLLALLYLFFLRVVWAVVAELRLPRPAESGAAPPTATRGRSRAPRQPRPGRRGRSRTVGLAITEPGDRTGQPITIADELTIGRGAGCAIPLDDSFASQLHARAFVRDGAPYIADLGSTNGTWVNGHRIGGETALTPGDRVQVGKTVFTVVEVR